MKNKLIVLIALLTASISFSFEPAFNDKRDIQNVFDFRVFDSFEWQIKAFTTERLSNSKLIQLAMHLNEPESKYITKTIHLIATILSPTYNQYEYHKNIIQLTREIINERKNISLPYDRLTYEINIFVDDLCEWMYTGANVNDALERFLFEEVVSQIDELDSLERFVMAIDQVFEKTLLDTRFDSDESRKGILDDSHLLGDFPSHLYSLNNFKQTQMIRTTAVVRDLELDPETGVPSKIMVCEEFEGYLEALKRKGKKHLYVNLMSRNNHYYEEEKSHLIENLEKNESFGSSIFVITLEKAKSNAFYMQSEEYENLSNANLFKQEFLKLLFQENGYYYLSSHLDHDDLKSRFKEAFDLIHANYFGNREELSVLERQDFIEIGYLKIIEIIVELSEVDYMNTTCRFSLDRGPSIFALYYLDQVLRHAEEPLPHLKRFLAYIFAPPLLVHNRPSHTYRIKRVQSVGERLLQLSQ